MEHVKIEEENYYTGSKLNIQEKKVNPLARWFMKLGLGKTTDEANLWVILTSIVTFGVAFIALLG